MTSRKQLAPDATTRDGWKATAAALGARLGVTDRTVRGLTSWIAQSAWRRMYYAEQPEMIDPKHDRDFPVDDLLDALRLIPAVRYAVDLDERDLIRIARHKGATWEQIGVALGAAESGARQTARGKYKRLGGDVNAAVPGRAAERAAELVAGGERFKMQRAEVEDIGKPVPHPAPVITFAESTEPGFVEPVLITFDEGPGQ